MEKLQPMLLYRAFLAKLSSQNSPEALTASAVRLIQASYLGLVRAFKKQTNPLPNNKLHKRTPQTQYPVKLESEALISVQVSTSACAVAVHLAKEKAISPFFPSVALLAGASSIFSCMPAQLAAAWNICCRIQITAWVLFISNLMG